MASLGKEAYVGKLIVSDSVDIAGKLKTSGSVQCSHKVVGEDDKNLVQIHQTGSIFYLKWSHVEQITSFETTANSTEVVVVVIGHGLAAGDVFTIANMPGITDINGIVAEDIEGPRTVSAVDDSTIFRFNAGSPANVTGVVTGVEPLIKINRYKFTDMATSSATWSYSTTTPLPPHTNIHTFSY